jgi:hypothetical protein
LDSPRISPKPRFKNKESPKATRNEPELTPPLILPAPAERKLIYEFLG